MKDNSNAKNIPTKKQRGCQGCLGRGILGLLVFMALLLVAGNIYNAIGTANDTKTYPMPGKLIDMGSYKLHLYCTGISQDSGPTVVLEAASGLAVDWGMVQPEITKTARVCSYDRAGYGWSDKGPLPRSSKYLADELHTLLTVAGEKGPYVLVGHSFGGQIVRLFAYEYPGEVIGLILVDARPEGLNLAPGLGKFESASGAFMARCGLFRLFGKATAQAAGVPETMLQDYPWPFIMYPQAIETMGNEDKVESDKEVQAAGKPGNLALIVIVHGIPGMFAILPADDASRTEADWQAAQKELAASSGNGQLIVAEGSGHAIPFERPDVVIEAIKQMLSSAP